MTHTNINPYPKSTLKRTNKFPSTTTPTEVRVSHLHFGPSQVAPGQIRQPIDFGQLAVEFDVDLFRIESDEVEECETAGQCQRGTDGGDRQTNVGRRSAHSLGLLVDALSGRARARCDAFP